MKSNFALSLSFEGIRLLHRAAGGWRNVGEVSLETPDMAADLAALRDKALALEPAGLRTKLLLPNAQIKYLTIETSDLSDAERLDAARAALDGATPYAVDDLAFDICADGTRTHIAAVAKETLAEAEGFATEHAFCPVNFASVPGDQPYLGAPFFGETACASAVLDGEALIHDNIAVVVIGDAEVPAERVIKDPSPVIEAPLDADAEQKIEPAQPEATAVANESAPPEAKPSEKLAKSAEEISVPPPVPPLAAPPPPETPSAGFASRRSTKTDSGGNQAKPVLQAPVADRQQQNAAPPVTASYADVVIPPRLAVSEIEPLPPKTAPTVEPKSARGGFLSRRRSKATAAAPDAAPVQPQPDKTAKAQSSEAERMTIFGARRSDVGGKPKFLGLMLTAALLVFLAGVAAWASVFLDDGINLSRFFGERSKPEFSTIPDPAEPPLISQEPVGTEVITASLDPSLTPEDSAVLDALRTPVAQIPEADLSQAELEAKYAATGIWSRAPQVPPEPAGLINIEDLYLTGIDPISPAADAIALPAASSYITDITLGIISSPTAPGIEFTLDERGLVVPTPQGTLSPDGVVVYLGKPPVTPPVTLTRFQTEPVDTTVRNALADVRPKPRPSSLTENYERGQLDGLTRSELATLRPSLRPQSIQERAALQAATATQAPIETDAAVAAALGGVALTSFENTTETATKFAIKASVRPGTRPSNFARIVRRAERSAPEEEVRVASVAAVAPRVVKPSIPSKASVAKQATVKNALNLRKVNLIGVYGKPSSRRALIRLGNGRYKKVTVGDRIDGGRVSAIGQSELRYTKGGRNVILKMPKG